MSSLLGKLGEVLILPSVLAGSGLFFAGLVSFIAWRRTGKAGELLDVALALVGGYFVPTGVLLLLYPLMDPRPNLSSIGDLYFCLAGLAILWTSLIPIRNNISKIDREGDGEEGDGGGD